MENTQLLDQLEEAYLRAIDSKDFNTDSKRIKKAIEALKLPNIRERVRKQLENNALKKYAKEALDVSAEQNAYVPIDMDKVNRYVEEGLRKFDQEHPDQKPME